mgnify:CR=1 FL=1
MKLSRKKKKIIVSVISDLITDQRVHKVCTYFHQNGYDVTLIGRCFKNSFPLKQRTYKTTRILCHFKNGIAQYVEFNIKLFIKLTFTRANIFLSNDLDTLTPNFIQAKLRGKDLIYDSHEYFTGTPELLQKPLKRKFWKTMEKALLPNIKYLFTVNNSIADRYSNELKVKMKVLRNLPYLNINESSNVEVHFPSSKFILLLQGAGINTDRGAEELIDSMTFLSSNFLLILIGSGNAWEILKKKTGDLNLNEKVWFIEKVPFDALRSYTRQAHLGLSLDKPNCLNYELSLPNKIFDYIHAGIPVLASPIKEVKNIIDEYDIGMYIDEVSPRKIADAVQWIYENPSNYKKWKDNTKKAATELCWEKEQHQLDGLLNAL